MSIVTGTGNVPRAKVLAIMAIAMATAIMLAGIAMTAGFLSTDGLTKPGALDPFDQQPTTNQVGQDIKTSFGIIAVEYVKDLDGLSSRSMSGATHGIPGLVDIQHAQIQAALAVTNRSAEPINFRIDEVALLVTIGGKTRILPPSGGDIPNTRILPDAGIEGHLSFVVPRKGANLTLQYNDPGRSDPVLVDLGKVDIAPAGSGHEHLH